MVEIVALENYGIPQPILTFVSCPPSLSQKMPTPETLPEIHVIAGPNGAGKTTFAKAFLPDVGVAEFLNADLLAAGLNPLKPEASAFEAGRILLSRWRDLVSQKRSFAFESTLSGLSYAKMLKDAKENGSTIQIHYLWVPSTNICLQRIRNRIKKGGHSVPPADVRRRYPNSIKNFFNIYLPLADKAWLWDVSANPTSLVANWQEDELTVHQTKTYESICKTAKEA